MTTRSISQIFDQYQKARVAFVQTIADLAARPQNVEILMDARVLELLKPLISDMYTQIQQCALIAIGRMAQHSEKVSKEIMDQDFMPIILANIEKQNKHYKKSVLFVIRALCKHNPETADAVAKTGGLETLILCLEDFEIAVKEGAAWAVGYIAKHSSNLAQQCVDAGAIPLLTLCMQEPELNLRQIAVNALSDIAKHSLELAQCVVDAGSIPHFAKNLSDQDEKLKRLVLVALSSCAKHSLELAEIVVEAEVFPAVLLHLAHRCPQVRKNAAALVRDVVKHSVDLALYVVNMGGIGALIEALGQGGSGANSCVIPCITALGYVAGHSSQLALSVLGSKAVVLLTSILYEKQDEEVLAVTAWALGQIGKHTPEHVKAVAAANAFPRLVELYESKAYTSEDLKFKCKTALKQCLQKCLVLSALEPLLEAQSPGIIKYVMAQFAKILPNDPRARRLFVTSGAMKKVQEIPAEPGSTLKEYITVINSCFPEEIVRYFSPGYPDSLLDKVEEYNPQIMNVYKEISTKESEMQTDIGVLLSKQTHSDMDFDEAV